MLTCLFFERIREELNRGKGLKQSVRDGFNNALSSILDANITTGLTALILFVFGSGPIKGFRHYIINWYCDILIYCDFYY